jgi:putative transposase
MKSERKNIRLKNYDYASEGWYFVTICTKDREYFFGEIMGDEIIYTETGKQALKFWKEIPQHFSNVVLNEYQIMPNHVHGLVGILSNGGNGCRDVACNVPTTTYNVPVPDKNQHMASISPKKGSLSTIIRSFKSAVTNWCNKNNHPEFGWQSRFHDRIVRNEQEFYAIRNYIIANIANWNKDKLKK